MFLADHYFYQRMVDTLKIEDLLIPYAKLKQSLYQKYKRFAQTAKTFNERMKEADAKF